LYAEAEVLPLGDLQRAQLNAKAVYFQKGLVPKSIGYSDRILGGARQRRIEQSGYRENDLAECGLIS
jgi:hypothetical protein